VNVFELNLARITKVTEASLKYFLGRCLAVGVIQATVQLSSLELQSTIGIKTLYGEYMAYARLSHGKLTYKT
jgi:hypothetical protein